MAEKKGSWANEVKNRAFEANKIPNNEVNNRMAERKKSPIVPEVNNRMET